MEAGPTKAASRRSRSTRSGITLDITPGADAFETRAAVMKAVQSAFSARPSTSGCSARNQRHLLAARMVWHPVAMARSPKARRRISAAEFARHANQIVVIQGLFGVWHLARVHKEFDGDLMSALILGEVAHHNIVAMVSSSGLTVDPDLARLGLVAAQERLLPCNAHSIATACGIPRETVRRKAAALIKRGWLTRNPKGEFFVTPLTSEHFRQFNLDLAERILEAAGQLREVLDGEA